MLDVFATEGHFADHLAAVLLSLPEEARGNAIAPTSEAARRFRAAGIEPSGPGVIRDRPVLVAGIGDLRQQRRTSRRWVALMEHGAGQSYGGNRQTARHPSYAGGINREADLFLHPGPHPAARDRAMYPRARVEVVGSPFLERLPAHDPAPAPVVAISTHFNLGFLPETRSAFAWIRPELVPLSKRYDVLGHGHPRIIEELSSWYGRNGIETVRDFREIVRRADVFVADNTSALFAFAATGRPVVVLNPSTYRREMDHGLRFWDAVGGPDGSGPARIGIRVDRPGSLSLAIARALELRPEDVEARERALELVYSFRGEATSVTAGVLLDWIGSLRARRAA